MLLWNIIWGMGMAVTIDNLMKDGRIDVIIRSDSALDVSDDEYMEYAKTLDEGLLKFKPGEEPTRWVMVKKIKYEHKLEIDNAKVKVNKGKVQLQLGFVSLEVAASLIDIKNPDSVPAEKRLVLKKSGDGTVSDDFMSALGEIPQELYNVRSTYLAESQKGQADLKKSSGPSLS